MQHTIRLAANLRCFPVTPQIAWDMVYKHHLRITTRHVLFVGVSQKLVASLFKAQTFANLVCYVESRYNMVEMTAICNKKNRWGVEI